MTREYGQRWLEIKRAGSLRRQRLKARYASPPTLTGDACCEPSV
jgi:hypothetical protein